MPQPRVPTRTTPAPARASRPGPLFSGLDVRLALRMLVKHPALTLVGGLGIALGTAISVGFFSVMVSMAYTSLPLDEGDRVVALENRDVVINNEERRALHDFVEWRQELTSIDDFGAFRTVGRNLAMGEGPPDAVRVAEMTASGFRAARVPPLLGRYLVDEDERDGAARVVVIGHEVWQNTFMGDAAVVGRDVRLDGVVHTIVGVMPEDFAFPHNNELWTPLRANPNDYERRAGPAIFMFGRLADGVTMQEAQAELDAIGQRAAVELPETHATLRPMVMPYVHSLVDIQGISLWELAQYQVMVSMLLLVIALNVGVLVYARTAMRHGEITVRSALGASRRRIVLQLFIEALVLSALAAAAGLAVAQYGVRFGYDVMYGSDGAPFWEDYGLRPTTVVYTLLLALLAAVIAGVLPALQATGRRLRSGLGSLGAGTTPRLGRVWTGLIVSQVAIAVALLPAAMNIGWRAIAEATTRPLFPVEEFLSASVSSDPENTSGGSAIPIDEIMRRLEAEPNVAAVTYRAHLPGHNLVQVEGDGAGSASADVHRVFSSGALPGWLDVYDARLLAGRDFTRADVTGDTRAVMVNDAFVRGVLGGADALGRRIRFVDPAGDAAGEETSVPWLEIVGVAQDLTVNRTDPAMVRPAVMHPVAATRGEDGTLVVRVRGTAPAAFAPRLRTIVAAVDPSLRLGVRTVAEEQRELRRMIRGTGAIFVLILLSVFLLSAAGIYALMSFTVTQRRREIGIRAALGAQPRRVLRTVFARAAGQVALGLVAGVVVATLLELATDGGLMDGRGAVILPVLVVVMTVVGLLAALGPARRGLRIEPTEALRGDG